MHYHSHPLHGLFMTAGIISALAAINVGAVAFGYDFYSMPMVVNNIGRYLEVVRYIVGIAGIISLVGALMYLSGADHCKK